MITIRLTLCIHNMKRDNTPSSKVAMANGMKLVEEFRDDEGEISSAYAITRQEWEKLKK